MNITIPQVQVKSFSIVGNNLVIVVDDAAHLGFSMSAGATAEHRELLAAQQENPANGSTFAVETATEQSVGQRLRIFRERNKYSQQDVATALQYSQGFISAIERGAHQPQGKVLEKLQELLSL